MSNKRRVLAQVLSIDAWHSPITYDGKKFSVHVELSFRNGRIGGDDPDFPFTFNIALKRALLTLELEQPLAIDRASVARHIPADQAELTKILAARDEAKTNVNFTGKITPASLALSLSGNADQTQSQSREDQIKVVQQIPRVIAQPHPIGEREYAWELSPGHGMLLEGQPWDPVEQPRLSARYIGQGRPAIEPALKAFVSCKLEDIEITDLKLKDQSISGILKEMAFNRVNEAAAIQQLKLTLREMELQTGSLGDIYSEMTIADVIVSEYFND